MDYNCFLLLFTNLGIGNKLGLSVTAQLAIAGLSGFVSVLLLIFLLIKNRILFEQNIVCCLFY